MAYFVSRLEATIVRKAEEAHPHFRSCLSAFCDQGQIHKELDNPCVKCKACGTKSCFNHGVPWHERYTCAQYDAMHPNAVSLMTSEKRIQSIAKRCPGKGCMFYVEKDGGCDNMYCSRCQQSWNWGTVKFDFEVENHPKAMEGKPVEQFAGQGQGLPE